LEELKLVSKGPIFEYIKKQTDKLNITNEIKDQIIDFFEEQLKKDIDKFCSWALEITELQNKRTLMEKDWDFIKKKMVDD